MMHWQVLLCDEKHSVYPLVAGVHRFHYRQGALTIESHDGDAAPAALRLSVKPSGLWLFRDEAIERVHVNGRPIRRIAYLRCGDVIHIEQSAALIQAQSSPVLSPSLGEIAHAVLRGLSGEYIGRCVRLDSPCCIGSGPQAQIQLADPALAPLHARVISVDQGVRLVMTTPRDTCLINGHRARAAWLRPGDQIVLADVHRFVIEGALKPLTNTVQASRPSVQPISGRSCLPLDRWPWLVVAALGLALLLGGLLWFGAH